MIPKEIQDRIVKRGNAIAPFHTSSRTYTREGDFKTGFFEGGQYGYTIRDNEVQSLKDEVERLKAILQEVCVRARIIFPETEDALDWHDEEFKDQVDLMLNISATLGLGEVDEEAANNNRKHLKLVQQQFKQKNNL